MICLNFEGDYVEHFLVAPDGLDDRGAFKLRNAPLALDVEGGSSDVASRPNCCSITAPSPSALASVTSQNFLDPEIAASKSGKAKTLGLNNSCNISRTMRSWWGVNSSLTPFRSRELSGRV